MDGEQGAEMVQLVWMGVEKEEKWTVQKCPDG
jgi:hypothetical protein